MTFAPGVIAPLLTPFDDDGSIATDLYVSHAQDLLAQGCAGVALFGTTGEGPSIGLTERTDALEALVSAGIDASLLMVGTGTTSLSDTVALTEHAAALGVGGVLVLPPFYFRQASQRGLVDYFSAMAVQVSAPIYLYHIPQVAGIGFEPRTVGRLVSEHENIVGIKDSTGDWDNTAQLLDIDDLITYPGSELPLPEALALGAPGCISATANTNARAIADVIATWVTGDHETARRLHEDVARYRHTVQQYAPIPAQKALLTSQDARWANLRPPMLPISMDDADRLRAALDAPS